MFNIYEENSLIIAFRKNLFFDLIKEEAALMENINAYKETKGIDIYLPAYFNYDGNDDSIIRYCYDKNNNLQCIQVTRKDHTSNAVYVIYKEPCSSYDYKND